MPIAPVKQLTKAEIVWLGTHRCKCEHTYLEHYNCYVKENPQHQSVGFLDIEASNLKAPFGIVYTYCIKELDGVLLKRAVTLKELYEEKYDKELLKQFIKDTERFGRLVVHYGTDYKFDLPFLRTRAVKWNLPFPEYKFTYASDTWSIAKSKFCFHSNRLETICQFFGISCKKHKLNPNVWIKMFTGNPKLMQQALNYIMKHNIEDVMSLEALWKKINKYANISKTSI